jgi:2-methylisocitrate lyase-like PEP mutase family enzyme
VLFAPGLPSIDAVRAVCSEVSKPVNVLVYGALANHTVEEFAAAGVARLSLGSGLSNDAYGALVETASSIKKSGGFGALGGRSEASRAFRPFLRR